MGCAIWRLDPNHHPRRCFPDFLILDFSYGHVAMLPMYIFVIVFVWCLWWIVELLYVRLLSTLLLLL